MIVAILCGVLLVILFGLYFLTKNFYEEDMQYINKKEYKLKDLMPMSLWVMDKLFQGRSKPSQKVMEHIRLIYGRREYHYRLRMYEAEKIGLGILLLIGVLFLTMLISVKGGEGNPLHGNSITKPAVGTGDKSYRLQAEIEVDGKTEIKDFTVLVPEEIPDEALAIEKLKIVAKELNALIRARSSNKEIVDRQLYLPDQYPGTPIEITWVIDTPEYIQQDGELRYDRITKTGQKASVTAVLTYGDATYQETIPITVYPKNLTREERLQLIEGVLRSQLESEALLEASNKEVNLPTTVEGHGGTIRWLVDTKGHGGLKFLLLGILIMVLMMVLKDYELKQKVDARNTQIRRSFPEFVITLTLLMNAGMTLSRSITSIGRDYVKQLHKGESPRFLYEEMLVTLQDIQNGVSEVKAYEDFGKRCKIPEMMRFTSVIIQNLKKGNDTLVMALQGQANEAWEIRKNIAKKEGEKASSKLLLPMGIMFLIIIIIVMVPAFLSFSV